MLIQIYHQLEPVFRILGVITFLLICATSVTVLFIWLVKTYWKVFVGIGVVATIVFFGMLIVTGL